MVKIDKIMEFSIFAVDIYIGDTQGKFRDLSIFTKVSLEITQKLGPKTKIWLLKIQKTC